MLNKAESNGSLHGLKVALSAPSVTHLMFADDLLIFCKANVEQVGVSKNVFSEFQKVSDQWINFEKSACLLPNKLHHKY